MKSLYSIFQRPAVPDAAELQSMRFMRGAATVPR